ncbi:hypothetical protein ACM66B_000866 [Microbotryomycetes sp. NB124-2]
MTALHISELNWWTTDAQLCAVCQDAGVKVSTGHIFFNEHKVNGKSKGLCCIETGDASKAKQILRWFQEHAFQGKRVNARLVPATLGANPFATLPKEPTRDNRSSRVVSGPATFGGVSTSYKGPLDYTGTR